MSGDDFTFGFAERLLDRNLRWIATADSKIPAVFALDASMLGVLAAILPRGDAWTPLAASFSGVVAVALLSSIACLALVAFPRLKGPKSSLVFFGTANNLSDTAFIQRIRQTSKDELLEDVAQQVHRNAEIASEKYHFIKWAMILAFVALPFWIAAIWQLYPLTHTATP